MTAEKFDPSRDLNGLANEACDLWQEHLASYATDATAKGELMRLMAPSHRLFAEWTAVMQNGPYGASIFDKNGPSGQTGSTAADAAGGHKPDTATATSRTAAAGAASDGSTLKLAQLADRVAKLEERLARFESGAAGKDQAPHHPPRPRAKS